jgi:hypothetical protein
MPTDEEGNNYVIVTIPTEIFRGITVQEEEIPEAEMPKWARTLGCSGLRTTTTVQL